MNKLSVLYRLKLKTSNIRRFLLILSILLLSASTITAPKGMVVWSLPPYRQLKKGLRYMTGWWHPESLQIPGKRIWKISKYFRAKVTTIESLLSNSVAARANLNQFISFSPKKGITEVLTLLGNRSFTDEHDKTKKKIKLL